MDPTIAIIAVLLIVALVLLWFTIRRKKTDELRDKYGDEYDRTVEDRGDRAKAEADLADRERRVKELDIRPLTSTERTQFTDEWHEVKSIFVDSPAEAILHADRMLAKMMQTRGYPMSDFDRRYEDLTVDHGDVARSYRSGHEMTLRQQSGDASTEDLRQGMKHYEVLFDELVRDADADRDHDGVPDRVESRDRDRDGIPDRAETRDRDGDGIPDRVETRDRGHDVVSDHKRDGMTGDRDGDGVPNVVDLDDDRVNSLRVDTKRTDRDRTR